MPRYSRIRSAAFAGTTLPLPMAARVSRCCTPLPAGGDGELYLTSVQLSPPMIAAEITLRGTAVAEELLLGRSGTLSLLVGAAGGQGNDRRIEIDAAVLHSVELDYSQSELAVAKLRFVAVATDGCVDPFIAEDDQ